MPCDVDETGYQAPVLQLLSMATSAWKKLPAEAFAKVDADDDELFYAAPRFVMHIDEAAVEALTRFYTMRLPRNGVILDLMSSWVSHLPQSFTGKAIGQGMNAEELAANPRLDAFTVHNLNLESKLTYGDSTFDAALCCVGVQDLVRPDVVFSEVARVLRRDAPIVISFSNRCFPTKAVAIWRSLDSRGRADLVTYYLRNAGFHRVEQHILCDGTVSDPLAAVVGYA